jgi:predicted CXXCH cytochrome family protein
MQCVGAFNTLPSRVSSRVAVLTVLALVLLFVPACRGEQFDPDDEATYVGSEACGDCHDRTYNTWQTTLHSQVIQRVEDNPRIVQGDFTVDFPEDVDPFTAEDAMMIHGVQWKQRYINEDWNILPAQWNYETLAWAPYHADQWKERDWRKECANCHVTGFQRDDLDVADDASEPWAELGIGCEACHGPGSQHVNAPALERSAYIVNPAKLPAGRSADVCGQCHTRGKSPDGEWSFPVDYMPGDQISQKNFVPVPYDNEKAWWPDGAIKQHRQQNIEWATSKHAKAGVTCIDCHTVHEATTKFQTRLAPVALCVTCHSNVSTDSVAGHAPIANAPQHADCVGCHMPPTGKSATRGDEHSHRFKVIKPQTTIELGDGDPSVQPNSCNLCHAHADDPPEFLQDALDSGLLMRFPDRATLGSLSGQSAQEPAAEPTPTPAEY